MGQKFRHVFYGPKSNKFNMRPVELDDENTDSEDSDSDDDWRDSVATTDIDTTDASDGEYDAEV